MSNLSKKIEYVTITGLHDGYAGQPCHMIRTECPDCESKLAAIVTNGEVRANSHCMCGTWRYNVTNKTFARLE